MLESSAGEMERVAETRSEDWVEVGRVAKPFGLEGWLLIQLHGDDPTGGGGPSVTIDFETPLVAPGFVPPGLVQEPILPDGFTLEARKANGELGEFFAFDPAAFSIGPTGTALTHNASNGVHILTMGGDTFALEFIDLQIDPTLGAPLDLIFNGFTISPGDSLTDIDPFTDTPSDFVTIFVPAATTILTEFKFADFTGTGAKHLRNRPRELSAEALRCSFDQR